MFDRDGRYVRNAGDERRVVDATIGGASRTACARMLGIKPRELQALYGQAINDALCELVGTAVGTVRSIMMDDEQKGETRLKAAQTVLKTKGDWVEKKAIDLTVSDLEVTQIDSEMSPEKAASLFMLAIGR